MIYMVLEAQAEKDAKRLAMNTPADRCWTAKVAGFEYVMLQMATPFGSGMYLYYGRVSMAYQARVAGKLDDDALVAKLTAIPRPVNAPPTEAAMRSALDGELSHLIKDAANALIANAKTAATSFRPGCTI